MNRGSERASTSVRVLPVRFRLLSAEVSGHSRKGQVLLQGLPWDVETAWIHVEVQAMRTIVLQALRRAGPAQEKTSVLQPRLLLRGTSVEPQAKHLPQDWVDSRASADSFSHARQTTTEGRSGAPRRRKQAQQRPDESLPIPESKGALLGAQARHLP